MSSQNKVSHSVDIIAVNIQKEKEKGNTFEIVKMVATKFACQIKSRTTQVSSSGVQVPWYLSCSQPNRKVQE